MVGMEDDMEDGMEDDGLKATASVCHPPDEVGISDNAASALAADAGSSWGGSPDDDDMPAC